MARSRPGLAAVVLLAVAVANPGELAPTPSAPSLELTANANVIVTLPDGTVVDDFDGLLLPEGRRHTVGDSGSARSATSSSARASGSASRRAASSSKSPRACPRVTAPRRPAAPRAARARPRPPTDRRPRPARAPRTRAGTHAQPNDRDAEPLADA
ncbi:MAG: hypothetical protein U0838_14555 [Chloroflexota bacterium]